MGKTSFTGKREQSTVDFSCHLYKIFTERTMKNVFRTLFTIVVTSSAFMIGYYLGQEKIMGMIPKFQEETEDKD